MKDNIVKLTQLLETSEKGQEDNKNSFKQSILKYEKEIEHLKKIIDEQKSKLQE